MNDISKTIKWGDKSWNPITGCKRDCFYCYAKKMRHRFYPNISWGTLIYHDKRWNEPIKVKKSLKIFVGSMGDICYWQDCDIKQLIKVAELCPQHIFQLLTKDYDFYYKYNFPRNCWLGVSSTDGYYSIGTNADNIKFVSLEPLLKNPQGAWINNNINWMIVGAMTGKSELKFKPQKQWIDNIINNCANFNIPLFIKDSIKWHERIQEFPQRSLNARHLPMP